MFQEKKAGIVVAGEDVMRGSMGTLFGSICSLGPTVLPPGGGMLAIAALEMVVMLMKVYRKEKKILVMTFMMRE